jgi:hypothetical protein
MYMRAEEVGTWAEVAWEEAGRVVAVVAASSMAEESSAEEAKGRANTEAGSATMAVRGNTIGTTIIITIIITIQIIITAAVAGGVGDGERRMVLSPEWQ